MISCQKVRVLPSGTLFSLIVHSRCVLPPGNVFGSHLKQYKQRMRLIGKAIFKEDSPSTKHEKKPPYDDQPVNISDYHPSPNDEMRD
jgi:hypothetical protein